VAADRRYKDRKKAFLPLPHVLRTRILEKFIEHDDLQKLVVEYRKHINPLKNLHKEPYAKPWR